MKNFAKNASFIAFFSASLFAVMSDANAVPAFARQTGMECAACHVGSFGPQLTSFGRNFKLSGYMLDSGSDATTTTDTKSIAKKYLNKFSVMAYGGIEHTNKGLRNGNELTGNLARYDENNNFTVDQVSLFYAGQVYSHVGALAQATYSNPNEHFAWDNTDIRYADSTKLAGKTLAYGVTLNNNPAVQDLWNTTPAWGFPYLTSTLAPTPAKSPYITGLEGTVGGAGVYGMWNDLVYAEITGYSSIANKTQLVLGESGAATSDHLNGVNPYWRLALQHDFGAHYVELGTYGMAAHVYPANLRGTGTDNYVDSAVDATYQFTSGNGKHAVSLYGSALHEHADLNATFASGGSANPSNSLTNLKANASYYYDNTYGLTFGPFKTTGGADSVLYNNGANNRPDSTGYTLQADYTPFGKAGTFAYPFVNMRFFVQYTAYTKFNGLSNNYDGTGRNASDNNTLYSGVWFAF